MTDKAREAISKMDEATLRKTASIHSHNKEIVDYIDTLLDRLDVSTALVENTDMSDFGDIN